VVQIQGRRRPASGLVYAPGVVITTMRVVGREDGVVVRAADGQVSAAELAGWDPASGIAVLRVAGLESPAIALADAPVRVGHLALALARSWSNALTVTAGVVSIIGGPLPTGRRRSIEQVIRTTAPMHDGFSGGAFLDAAGGLIGMTTALTIRGLNVVIPADLVWKVAATVLEHGRLKRGYLGISGQPVRVPARQYPTDDADAPALLIAGVTEESPAADAGLLVGDLLLSLNGTPIGAPDDLVERLVGDLVGQPVTLGILRGRQVVDVVVTVGERPGR
jgi:S1-C subfamily serine protease